VFDHQSVNQPSDQSNDTSNDHSIDRSVIDKQKSLMRRYVSFIKSYPIQSIVQLNDQSILCVRYEDHSCVKGFEWFVNNHQPEQRILLRRSHESPKKDRTR